MTKLAQRLHFSLKTFRVPAGYTGGYHFLLSSRCIVLEFFYGGWRDFQLMLRQRKDAMIIL